MTQDREGADVIDFDFAAEDEEFRARLREFLDEHLPEDWQGIFAGEDDWLLAGELCAALGEQGWLTMAWPREYGGSEATIWRQAVAQEELWAHNEPRGAQYMNVNWIGPAIMHFGTEEQKRFFLPKMAAGRMIWAQGFSEPEAGSDLASLRCRAEVVDGGFVVNGQKTWTSYGGIADYMFLLARTDPGSKGKRGLSVLLVDLNLPGVTRREIDTTLGHHRQCEEFFEDVFVPREALLGEVDDGWRVTGRALAFERSGSARYARSARILGIMEREYGEGFDDGDKVRFAELLAFGRATELVNYDVMARKESGDLPRWRSSATRIHNALLEQEVTAFAEDVCADSALLGGDDIGAVQNGEVEALARNATAATVTAGAYEVQMGIIWRDGLGGELAR